MKKLFLMMAITLITGIVVKAENSNDGKRPGEPVIIRGVYVEDFEVGSTWVVVCNPGNLCAIIITPEKISDRDETRVIVPTPSIEKRGRLVEVQESNGVSKIILEDAH